MHLRRHDELLGALDQTAIAEARKRMRPEDLERIVVIKRNSSCSLKSWCVRHKRHCSAAAATVHAAGTPCVDWSTQPGASHLGEAGTSALAWCCWIAQRLLLREEAILQENVGSFPEQLLASVVSIICLVAYILLVAQGISHPRAD